MNEKEIDDYTLGLYEDAKELALEMLSLLHEHIPEDRAVRSEVLPLATIMVAVNSVQLYKRTHPEMATVLQKIAIDMFNVI